MIELIDTFIKPLELHGLRYVVTGSVASMAYGEPRLTNGIDLILQIQASDCPTMARAFPETDYYLPPSEVILNEQNRSQRGHFNIIHQHTLLKADVYLAGADALHRWAFTHARPIEIDGIPVKFAPPEYVIIRKLEFHREGGSEKHLRDIAAMLVESGPEFDDDFLAREIETRGLRTGWLQAQPRES